MFRFCGLWPNEKSGWLYQIWSIIFVVFVCFGFPISQLACIFFVDSVDAIVDHLILTSTVIIAVAKSINVMVRKRKMVQLFNALNAIDENLAIENRKYREIFDIIKKNCDRINNIFLGAYFVAWTILALQAIFSTGHTGGGWSSTYLYPSEFLQKPSIYVSGLFYQAASNLILCVLDAALDTYPVILLNTLSGHIDVLKIQLQEFDAKERQTNDYQSLVRFCENYKNVLKYGDLILIQHDEI